ncbi:MULTISPECIES: hypothetical protein [Streptomyces]|uniref:hypothetical protein n=1 Tax=Streptomyces TaxID=1883 RepID=UPI00081B5E04|nr:MULTISPECIES: hypothetical protein [unclassified Streptomyces]MYQ85476.1 hypothetical protein [Streptomyces sp. SID4936]SCE05505.1 hypothetical protein GA0115234_1056238 [Streptomyces sp. DvalAA-43]
MTDRLPVTRALAALVEKTTGRPCGIGELPRVEGKSGWEPAASPYTVLDSLPAEFGGPPLWDWHADAAWSYQITSVGERGDQVEWLADRVRNGVVGRTDGGWAHDLLIPEARVIDRELTYDAGGEPSVSAAGAIVSYVQRVTITVTPA